MRKNNPVRTNLENYKLLFCPNEGLNKVKL